MKRHARPVLESLEGKQLLSGLAVTVPTHAPTHHHQPAPPTKTPAVVKAMQNGLSVSVTSNATTYRVGSTVKMTLTATNNTSSAVRAQVGPSVDGFTVTNAAGKVVWRSNSGIQPNFIALENIEPGKSLTLTATWTASSPGTYTIRNTFAPAASETIHVK